MDLEGKVCVITGATSGIGKVAAEQLARMGARMVVVARDPARGQATLARLSACKPSVAHSLHLADLSRVREVKRVAADIAAAESRIDILINNAGALYSSRKLTEDDLERHFATNHMAYVVLTHGLRERLFTSAPARVINTASEAHRSARLDFGDLQVANGFNGISAYKRSKLCNILYTRELARRWAGSGVTVNCFHPGFVASRFGDRAGGWLAVATWIAKRFAISPEKGAETLLYLATSQEVVNVSGGYFVKNRMIAPSVAAQDDESARRLCTETARLAGLE
jgi:NAD(P)-dependent dehydrogenase (short-subunit alcohol dehydrogenase family)